MSVRAAAVMWAGLLGVAACGDGGEEASKPVGAILEPTRTPEATPTATASPSPSPTATPTPSPSPSPTPKPKGLTFRWREGFYTVKNVNYTNQKHTCIFSDSTVERTRRIEVTALPSGLKCNLLPVTENEYTCTYESCGTVWGYIYAKAGGACKTEYTYMITAYEDCKPDFELGFYIPELAPKPSPTATP